MDRAGHKNLVYLGLEMGFNNYVSNDYANCVNYKIAFWQSSIFQWGDMMEWYKESDTSSVNQITASSCQYG